MSDSSDDELLELAKKVQSYSDFCDFLNRLSQNFREHSKEWQNNTIEHYLDGICAFTESIEGYYKNTDQEMDLKNPSWRVFTDILLAGRVYE